MSITSLKVSAIPFTQAAGPTRERGLLGYASFIVAGRLREEGLAARRTLSAESHPSFPAPRVRSGCEHSVVRPISVGIHAEVEQGVLPAIWDRVGT